MKLRVFHIGNLAHVGPSQYAVLKNYGRFYHDLSRQEVELEIYGPAIAAGQTGSDFVGEIPLPPSIRVIPTPGNTPDSPLSQFLANNLRLLVHVLRHSLDRTNYFIFLPSPGGAAAVMTLLAARRCRSLGLYIGGDFAAEQRHERRTLAKHLVKRVGALLISEIVAYGVRHADYVLTTSPEYVARFTGQGRIFLASSLLNVQPEDLSLPLEPPTPDRPVLAFCGDLRHSKGVMVLLEAIDRLVRRHPRVHYVLRVIGSGAAEREMRAFVHSRGLQDRVEFCGQIVERSRLVETLRQSFALVLPSFSEGFPRVAYECFTLGVPVILTPVGGVPRVVRDRDQVLFIRPGEAGDIVEQAALLRDHPELRQQLIENARALMRETIFPYLRRHGPLSAMVMRGVEGELAVEARD